MLRIIKIIAVFACVCISGFAHVNDEIYNFVKDFDLVSTKMTGSILTVTVTHNKTFFQDAQFDLVVTGACLMTDPAQCGGLIVRKDFPTFLTDEKITTSFDIDLSQKYGEKGVHLYLQGPNGSSSVVEW